MFLIVYKGIKFIPLILMVDYAKLVRNLSNSSVTGVKVPMMLSIKTLNFKSLVGHFMCMYSMITFKKVTNNLQTSTSTFLINLAMKNVGLRLWQFGPRIESKVDPKVTEGQYLPKYGSSKLG